MKRLIALTILLLGLSPVFAQDDIQRGKIKAIDLDRLIVTLTTADDRERVLAVIAETRIFDAAGKDQRERLQGFKVGADVFFKPARKAGLEVLVGIKLVNAAGPSPKPAVVDTSKLKPLPELGSEEYQGFKGGLYPEGKNERPTAHEAAGLAIARSVQPLDAQGKPAASGNIVLLSIGMSNTAQASQGFQRALAGEPNKNPHFVFVNGAQGGMTASAIQDPDDNATGTRYWTTIDERLKASGLGRAQVQVIWMKQADAGPTQGFPGYAKKLQGELARIVQVLPQRFPNVKLAYLTSRTYGGYATTRLNPEPYAFESGFAVKWLIEQQLQGDPSLSYAAKSGMKAPWLGWGPYFWANGTTRRADGFSYAAGDFIADGTHLSPTGQEKVGRLMLQFFQSDSTARPWFVAP